MYQIKTILGKFTILITLYVFCYQFHCYKNIKTRTVLEWIVKKSFKFYTYVRCIFSLSPRNDSKDNLSSQFKNNNNNNI